MSVAVDRYALDTNAIREDFRFRRNPWRLLLREGRHGRLRILVPQIVFDEAVNLYREDVEAAIQASRKARRSLLGLGADEASVPTVELSSDDRTAAYADELRETLEGANTEFLPYPNVSHEEVARRALGRRRPFDAEGKDGYRDTLVWETVLAAANDTDPITLITADAAFSAKGSTELLPVLQDEVVSRGLPAGVVKRAPTISSITDQLPSVPDLVLAADHFIQIRADVLQFIEEALSEEALDYDERYTSLIGLDVEIDSFYIDSVDGVSNIEVVAGRELDDGDVALDLTAELRASLRVYLHKSEAYPYEGDDLHIINYDHNESMSEGFVSRTFEAEFEAIFDPKEETIYGVQPYSFTAVAP